MCLKCTVSRRCNRARINITASVGVGITESVPSNIVHVVFALNKNVI